MQEDMNELLARFQRHAQVLAKDGHDIVQTFDWRDAHITHMTMGICGEAGELLDAVKKAVIYKKPLDRENVVEELGDMLFYMQDLMRHLGITWNEVLHFNIDKLKARYPEGYSDAAAQARLDKQ